MESSHFDLATCDGKVSVTIYPALTRDHYADLCEVACNRCSTAGELRGALEAFASGLGCEVEFD